MKKCVNGQIFEMTAEEIAELEAEQDRMAHAYWQGANYEEAVDAKIRERYSASAEFAILRQRDEKPEEYAAYYAYCEECKAYVRAQIAKYS